jgi:hypothetical protein
VIAPWLLAECVVGGWCPGGGHSFKGVNATKALAHVAKIRGKNIHFCKGNIPRNKIIQYRELWIDKSNAKSDRSTHSARLDNGISDIQSRAMELMFGASSRSDSGSGNGEGRDDVMLVDAAPARKRAHDEVLVVPSGRSGGVLLQAPSPPALLAPRRFCGNVVDPDAPERMNIAVADFIHSNLLPFSLAEDPKFLKILQIAKSLGAYKPPNQQSIGGKCLDALHLINWREQMKTLLSEATTFSITTFGDGATIKSIALMNVLAAGVNNSFVLLAIADCTDHLAKGGKKDASHISTIIKPLIANLEGEVDELQRKYMGIVDLVFFYGARSNVQNAGQLL